MLKIEYYFFSFQKKNSQIVNKFIQKFRQKNIQYNKYDNCKNLELNSNDINNKNNIINIKYFYFYKL